jgi:hypothetical protein
MHLSLKGSLDRQPLTDRLGDRLLAEYGGAAAAYSLRALNGNGDSVVRVRRASDNDEEDFTAEQIELGEMVNWVNSQTVPPLDIGVETSGGRIPVPEGGTSIGIPAAAYSLRNLSTTYTGNVVDVRRSSGGTESFTAAEVADGTLTDWVLAPVSSFIGNKMYFDRVNDYINLDSFISYTGDFTLTFSFIPDTLDGTIQPVVGNGNIDYIGVAQINGSDRIYVSTLAGSTQFIVLDSNFTEKAVNDVIISRSGSTITFTVNGDVQSTTLTYSTTIPISRIGARGIGVALLKGIITELDFGNGTTFDGTIADGNTIGTVNGSPELFTGQGFDGFVTQWYDQSGNDNHATQGTDASQPKIVDGGSLVSGGIDFDGVNDGLQWGTAPITSTDSASSFIVCTSRTTAGTRTAMALSDNTPNVNRWYSPWMASSVFYLAYGDSVTKISLGAADTSKHLWSTTAGLTTTEAFKDGVTGGTTASVSGISPLISDNIGAANGGSRWDGTINEIIIYDSDQSANRTAIEANIGETYGITGIPAYDNTVDGFVETWYDQSGNGNDATQSVAASQPKIVDAGVLVTNDEGNPAIQGADGKFFNLSAITGLTDVSIFFVGTVSSQFEAITGWSTNLHMIRFATSIWEFVANSTDPGNMDWNSALTSGDTTLFNFTRSSGTVTGYANSVASNTTSNANSNPFGLNRIFRRSSTNFNDYLGKTAELILYSSDQLANRVAIETNINDHYNIY